MCHAMLLVKHESAGVTSRAEEDEFETSLLAQTPNKATASPQATMCIALCTCTIDALVQRCGCGKSS